MSDQNQPPGYGNQPGGGYSGGYGGPQGGQPDSPPPNNNLVMAILSIFCCWPLAIPAIVFAAQVNGKWAQGDVAGAHDSANKAKKFAMWAIILGVILLILYVILVVVGAVSFSGSTSTTLP